MEFKKEIININGEETCKYFVDGEQVDIETYEELLEQDYIESQIQREECEDALDLIHSDESIRDFLIESCIGILDRLDIEYCDECVYEYVNHMSSSVTPIFLLGYLYGRDVY